MAALKYPSIFGKVILQSPYVDADVLKAVENFKDPGSISIYHIVGKGEDRVVTMDKTIKDF